MISIKFIRWEKDRTNNSRFTRGINETKEQIQNYAIELLQAKIYTKIEEQNSIA